MKDQFNFIAQDKIEVIENCYSFEYENLKINFNNKKNQILFLSNIMFSKGIFDLLDISDKLLRLNSDLKIKIAGKFISDYNLNAEMTKKLFFKKYNILKNNHVDRIFYLGSITEMKKLDYLVKAKFLFYQLFHKSEAFPISIIEAMKFGNAVVTTDHNYLSDIISNMNGFIIEKNNPEVLYNSIQKLLNAKSKLRTIQEYNVSVSEIKYSPLVYNQKIKNLFDNLYD